MEVFHKTKSLSYQEKRLQINTEYSGGELIGKNNDRFSPLDMLESKVLYKKLPGILIKKWLQ